MTKNNTVAIWNLVDYKTFPSTFGFCIFFLLIGTSDSRIHSIVIIWILILIFPPVMYCRLSPSYNHKYNIFKIGAINIIYTLSNKENIY